MRFEHLVQVNNFENKEDFHLTHEQLWAGLVWRVREPNYFLESVESFSLIEDSESYLKRRLKFSGLSVEDEVTFKPKEKINIKIIPSSDVAGGGLIISIVEPENNSLFVRFIYSSEEGSDNDAPSYDAVIQQAYVEIDVESIRLIKKRYQTQ